MNCSTRQTRLHLAGALALLVSSLSARAHPGHSLHDASAAHLLSSPGHLAVLALGGVAFFAAGYFVRSRLPRRLLQGCGAAGVLAAVMVWGLRA
jgi:hypothetical protein